MESKKRKREADVSPPRITFVTPSRTFERLFKETSLEATKATVLKKLGLDAGTTVELSQGRDGRTIDLEDEDDFDALRSYAFSKGGVEVRVTFPGSSKFAEPQKQPEVSALPEEPSARVQKKKKTSRMTASVVAPDAPSIPIGAPDTAAFPEEKDKRKSKTIEASALPSSPTAIPGAPASAALCGSTEAPAKKSKSKRKKKLSVPDTTHFCRSS
ncbi:hypothetical protein DFH11DRAFT_430814 [Phellopilus nigrolimitatus]|nr:hypothetical protein DFH11DRAFT_430814 [Phellopilus nigrolimitatus]